MNKKPSKFPPLPPEHDGQMVFPENPKYKELLRAFGYSNPAFYPKMFRQEKEGAWTPVL